MSKTRYGYCQACHSMYLQVNEEVESLSGKLEFQWSPDRCTAFIDHGAAECYGIIKPVKEYI